MNISIYGCHLEENYGKKEKKEICPTSNKKLDESIKQQNKT